jgi:osmoprotectant transport system ATP-binding protein
MIRFENVIKNFGDITAVDDLSFEVAEGEVCVLIGPSGCGKSTTLRIVNRMIEPTKGWIYLRDKPIGDYDPDRLRLEMGYVIQKIGLFPHMRVAANISIVPRLLRWPKEKKRARTDELLDLVGLAPERYRDKYPHELSGGEAQRIGVARALAADPPVLLMDEPFGAVDPLNRKVLQSEFLKIQRELKKTVIFVTHDLDEAIRIADRILLMRAGKQVQYDTPEETLANPKNKFVRDFVGTDRALKRLTRFEVADYVRQVETFVLGQDEEEDPENHPATVPRNGGSSFVWVVDGERHLKGWLNREILERERSFEEAFTEAAAEEFGIPASSTLRDALAKLLAENSRALPVIDAEGRFLGELGLPTIEEITGKEGLLRDE